MALLYTSISGQRRLRIHNLSLANGSNYAQVYRHADIDAVALTLFKQGAFQLKLYERLLLFYAAERLTREKTPKDVRDFITSRCAQILAAYRCEQQSDLTWSHLSLQREMLRQCTSWPIDTAGGIETATAVC